MLLDDITASVYDRLGADKEVIGMQKIEDYVTDALELLSIDFPRILVYDITGDGGYEYSLPSGWVNDYSAINKIEFPQGERPPTYLDEGEDKDFYIYNSATGTYKLMFITETPTSSQTIRLWYTVPWTTSNISNIPQQITQAFIYLVLSICCKYLARYFTKNSDSTIGVDLLDYKSKATEYYARSKEAHSMYKQIISGEGAGAKPVAATKHWESRLAKGVDWMTHTENWRYDH